MFKEYYKLAKPGIVYGNLLSTIGAFLLASNGAINLWTLIATILGTGFIIGSACVFNNILDIKIDINMPRTKNRALVIGSITAQNAFIFGTLLLVIGSLSLVLFVNLLTLLIGYLGFIWYVIIYGYAKRRTHHSTLIGTIAGSTPPVAGYVAVTNSLDLSAFILFLILTFWQMPHFYAIAIFRAKEYAAANVPILSLTKGIKRAKLEIVIYAILFSLTAPLLTLVGSAGASYALIMISFSIVWLRVIAEDFNNDDSNLWARRVFGQSLIVLLAFCIALSLNAYLP